MAHIQPLETRMLMSVTAATLNADFAAVVASRGAISAAIVPDATALVIGTKLITADLKGTTGRAAKAANARLLSVIHKDEAKLLAALRANAAGLTGKGVALSAKAKGAALAVLVKSTSAKISKASADVTGLNTAVATKLATLLADSHVDLLLTDLANLAAANSSNAVLANDVAALGGSVNVQAFNSAAQTFATATTTLSTDLQSAITSTNPAGTLTFSPVKGKVGSTVVINGIGFIPPLSITFAGNAAASGSFTSTKITVTVPAGALTGPIVVTTQNGTFTTGTSFVVTG